MTTSPYDVLRELCVTSARLITSECREMESDNEASASLRGLHGCDVPMVQLLGRQAAQVLLLAEGEEEKDGRPREQATKLLSRRLADLVDAAHARFYAFAPSEVPACWRQLYTDASILQFAQQWLQLAAEATEKGDGTICSSLEGLVRPLDMALILAGGAGPVGRGRAWIHGALDALQSVWEEEKNRGDKDDRPKKKMRTEKATAETAATETATAETATTEATVTFSIAASSPSGQRDWSACPTFSDNASRSVFVPPVSRPVKRSGALGLEGFQAYLDQSRGRGGGGPQPLVMTGLTDGWPARQAGQGGRPWAVPAYLWWRTLGGRRLVPVEVGRSYVDAGWTQAVVQFSDVLSELCGGRGRGGEGEDTTPSSSGPMYLAQHALFAQMPRLRDDISVPDECYTTAGDGCKNGVGTDTNTNTDAEADDNSDIAQEPLVHAWLGPPGTITPLHTDPHHNLLAQVVGRKYVRLYSPAQTAKLRPRGCESGVDMGNTSTLDVGLMEGWDVDAEGAESTESTESTEITNAFRQAPYVDCILEPGDTLYIPRGWWHYVRGLAVSFSVSFWWD